jgi:hypothetical protein
MLDFFRRFFLEEDSPKTPKEQRIPITPQDFQRKIAEATNSFQQEANAILAESESQRELARTLSQDDTGLFLKEESIADFIAALEKYHEYTTKRIPIIRDLNQCLSQLTEGEKSLDQAQALYKQLFEMEYRRSEEDEKRRKNTTITATEVIDEIKNFYQSAIPNLKLLDIESFSFNYTKDIRHLNEIPQTVISFISEINHKFTSEDIPNIQISIQRMVKRFQKLANTVRFKTKIYQKVLEQTYPKKEKTDTDILVKTAEKYIIALQNLNLELEGLLKSDDHSSSDILRRLRRIIDELSIKDSDPDTVRSMPENNRGSELGDPNDDNSPSPDAPNAVDSNIESRLLTIANNFTTIAKDTKSLINLATNAEFLKQISHPDTNTVTPIKQELPPDDETFGIRSLKELNNFSEGYYWELRTFIDDTNSLLEDLKKQDNNDYEISKISELIAQANELSHKLLILSIATSAQEEAFQIENEELLSNNLISAVKNANSVILATKFNLERPELIAQQSALSNLVRTYRAANGNIESRKLLDQAYKVILELADFTHRSINNEHGNGLADKITFNITSDLKEPQEITVENHYLLVADSLQEYRKTLANYASVYGANTDDSTYQLAQDKIDTLEIGVQNLEQKLLGKLLKVSDEKIGSTKESLDLLVAICQNSNSETHEQAKNKLLAVLKLNLDKLNEEANKLLSVSENWDDELLADIHDFIAAIDSYVKALNEYKSVDDRTYDQSLSTATTKLEALDQLIEINIYRYLDQVRAFLQYSEIHQEGTDHEQALEHMHRLEKWQNQLVNPTERLKPLSISIAHLTEKLHSVTPIEKQAHNDIEQDPQITLLSFMDKITELLGPRKSIESLKSTLQALEVFCNDYPELREPCITLLKTFENTQGSRQKKSSIRQLLTSLEVPVAKGSREQTTKIDTVEFEPLPTELQSSLDELRNFAEENNNFKDDNGEKLNEFISKIESAFKASGITSSDPRKNILINEIDTVITSLSKKLKTGKIRLKVGAVTARDTLVGIIQILSAP